MRIGLDAMGGDRMPHAPVEGAVAALPELPDEARVVLYGDPEIVAPEIAKHAGGDRLELVAAAEVVDMDDHASRAIVQKPDSSIAVGLKALKAGEIDAFISAGHTGAVMAGAVITLSCADGVLRPTVGAFMPSANARGWVFMADVGANPDAKPDNLAQFARLASLYLKEVWQIENPSVKLLNIGEEKSKGNQTAIKTYELLEAQDDLNFTGNAQGWDILKGGAEIVVCDGFTGNVLLKYTESLYHFMKPKLEGDPLLEQFDAERVGGLPFLGVKGNVIIGHGISGPKAFKNMILRAVEVARSNLLNRIANVFSP